MGWKVWGCTPREKVAFYVDVGSRLNEYLTVQVMNQKQRLTIPAQVSHYQGSILKVSFVVDDLVDQISIGKRYSGIPVCSDSLDATSGDGRCWRYGRKYEPFRGCCSRTRKVAAG